MKKKENVFLILLKQFLIFLFIVSCTIGGVLVGHKLKENKKEDVVEVVKQDDDKIEEDNTINNSLFQISDMYESIVYDNNNVVITLDNKYYFEDESLADFVSTCSWSFGKKIVSVKSFDNISPIINEKTTKVDKQFIAIFEDGSVLHLIPTSNLSVSEEKISIFDNYEIKDIYNISCSEDGICSSEVQLIDNEVITVDNK